MAFVQGFPLGVVRGAADCRGFDLVSPEHVIGPGDTAGGASGRARGPPDFAIL